MREVGRPDNESSGRITDVPGMANRELTGEEKAQTEAAHTARINDSILCSHLFLYG